MPVVALGAIAVGGAIAGAAAKKKAAAKAAAAQQEGIQQQENILRKKLDPAALNRLAQEVDKERALNRIELQKEVDPEIAQLREFSRQSLLNLSQQDEQSKQSQQVADKLYSENIQADPRLDKIKDTILNRAQAELDAGASLPAEFQAELVRSGLEAGAGAGIGTSGRSVGGVTSRLLGSAGIALQQQREQQATNLVNTADAITKSRQQILASIFPTVKVQEDAKYNRAVQGLQISESLLPESGLSGGEAVNIEVAKQKGLANTAAQSAGVKAQQAQDKGNFTASLIGAGTSLATSGIGAIGAAPAVGSGINYGSLAQNVIGAGGNAAGITNNPYYGLPPGQVPYGYQGDPSTLVNRRYI